MKLLMILNDPPYGTERTYNGLRLALSLLSKAEPPELTVFLMGDAAASANAGQKTPNGYYNVERMLKGIVTKHGTVLCCGTCLDARGIALESLVAGCRRSTMEELTEATAASDKVLVF